MGFSKKEYWSVLPCPPLRDLPNPETESASLMWVSYMGLTSPALAREFFTANATWEALNSWVRVKPMYGVQGTQQKRKKKKGNLKK